MITGFDDIIHLFLFLLTQCPELSSAFNHLKVKHVNLPRVASSSSPWSQDMLSIRHTAVVQSAAQHCFRPAVLRTVIPMSCPESDSLKWYLAYFKVSFIVVSTLGLKGETAFGSAWPV